MIDQAKIVLRDFPNEPIVWSLLGVSQMNLGKANEASAAFSKVTNLSPQETSYVLKIQNNLNEYLDIWTLIDNIWHLKPLKVEYMNIWKTNQEKEMFLQKGNALKDEKLSNFLRMLNVSIPHKSFDVLKSYALLLIDQERNLVEAGLNF